MLITGAGGSIGSELARQVHRFGPATLVLLDRDESALHAVQLSIYGHGLLDGSDTVLADIRDVEALREVFARAPAARSSSTPRRSSTCRCWSAIPDEGWKTNVLGTRNVLRSRPSHDVEHFVNISTDKAADATSVLGSTKRIGRAAHGVVRRADRASLHQRAVRQRARLARLDAAHVQRPDRAGRARSRSPIPT